MSHALPLPSHPHLGYYRKLAKDLLKASASDADPTALRGWLKQIVSAEQIERAESRLRSAKIGKLTEAQYYIARAHGFASWPKFVRHVEDLQNDVSPDAKFEQAADAIAAGDIATLRWLLEERPELIRQRSSRGHRSTLLHYVSANGIEDFRQRTPPNIVEITRLLLDAGAEVNAESDAYGGHSMTLGLAATSVHPEAAGVQIALLELLLDRGAMIERVPGEAVNGCLANGRPLAARYLSEHGAYLDFENAAGAGWLDRVKELAETTPEEKRGKGLVWACAYGHNDVVTFLLDYGVDPAAGADMTGLHLAAHEGHLDTVKLLLARNAPLEAKNMYGGTVLDQTLWSAVHHPRPSHREIVETLIAAGAKVEDDWSTGIPDIDELLIRARPSQPEDAGPIHELLRRARRARFETPDQSRDLFTEAAAMARRSGADRELVEALKGSAQIDRDLGRRAEALPFYEEAVAVCRGLGDPLLLAHTVRHLGDLHHDDSRDDLAEPLYAEAIALYRASEDTKPLDLANAVRSLAVIKDSDALWEEAFHLYVATNVPPGVAESALRLAQLAHGDRDRSREWLRIATAAAEASGDDNVRRRVREAGEEMGR